MVENLHSSNSTLNLDRQPVLQRMDSSVLNSLSSGRKLAHQPSKLDLIDDTTLTSLPLAPPPPRAKLRRGNSSCSKFSRTSDLAPTKLNLAASTSSFDTSISVRPDDVATINESEDYYDTTLGADDTFEEQQDPIVLVEDYMRTDDEDSNFSRSVSRKASLANFKKKYMIGRSQSAMQLPNGAPFRGANKRSISAEDNIMKRSGENLEAIFGKIPGADKLKYCDLCDKPLYEISSVIRTTEEKFNLTRDDSMTQLYNEFVCWECINVYDRFLNELYEAEVSEARHVIPSTGNTNNTTEKLLGIFNGIRESYQTRVEPPRKQLKTGFSTDLIDRLHYLSTMSEPPKNGVEWLANLRNRLRWKWRLDDFLPNPFSFDKQRNS